MDILSLIGRSSELFGSDVDTFAGELSEVVSKSNFLVVGGAGSIGQAVTTEIFRRDPKVLHVVDISENNMVELVRNLRSTLGYGRGQFKTFAIDFSTMEMQALLASENYDVTDYIDQN